MTVDYKKIDSLLMEIRNELDYQKYLTPVNFEEENRKFVELYNQKEIYNPQYIYNKFDNRSVMAKYNSLLSMFDFDGSEIGEIYKKYIELLYPEIMMYSSIGNDCFSELSVEVFGQPDKNYFDSAVETLNCQTNDADSYMEYDAEKMADIFDKRIKSYGFVWEVVLSPSMAARISVEPEQKRVYINKEKRFSRNDSMRLQVHEIDTHILRTENGYLRNNLPFAFGTAKSMIHEEGMALYNEFSKNLLDEFSLMLYAARFIISINIDKTFYELYDILKKYGCSDFMSMYVVSRFKRGLSDTSHEGGFIKDYLYFQGFQDIKNAIQKDKSIYQKMYFGSINLDDVLILDKMITNAIENNNIILPMDGAFIM